MRNATRLSILLLAIVFCSAPARASGYEPSLETWRTFSKTAEAGKLTKWLKLSAQSSLTGRQAPAPPKIEWPPFDGRLGIFITLLKKNKVRGCYGAFDHPTVSLDALFADYLKGALRRDHRYQPVDAGDVDGLTIVVTLAGRRLPLQSAADIDISQYGILATFEGDMHDVVVPAEIRSLDALKNRWKGRQIQQLEAFHAVTIK